MSNIGYYRYKKTATSNSDVYLYINGELVSTKTIIVKEFCTNNKLIKYLNKDGQYRFYTFNRFWESKDKPKEIGRTNKIITSLFNSQSSESTVGYKNERTLEMTAENVSQSELDILNDLWKGPKVYLYIGTGSDLESDWLEVSISAKDTITRIRKGGYKDITITVLLPEWYSITLL